MKRYLPILSIVIAGLLILLINSVKADQTGDCTAGSQYCEQNSMTTTSTASTVNQNTNVSTSTSTSTATNSNVNQNTNSSTNVNTSTATNQNTNVNTSSSNNVNTSTSNNVNTSTSSSNNVNTSSSNNVNTSTSNNVNTSTSSSNNVNQNTNFNQSTNNSTSENKNYNESSSTSNVQTNNKNINESNSRSNNTNRNINESKSEQTINQNIKTEAPPASAIAPSIMSYSQDLCTVGRSGAFQGQVFGLSAGRTVRDENCERLKLSKYLYDTGMKVAAVSVLCLDPRVFKAMEMAGTPCPYFGKIGEEARFSWAKNPKDRPDYKEAKAEFVKRCAGTENSVGQRKSRITCKREFDKGI